MGLPWRELAALVVCILAAWYACGLGCVYTLAVLRPSMPAALAELVPCSMRWLGSAACWGSDFKSPPANCHTANMMSGLLPSCLFGIYPGFGNR